MRSAESKKKCESFLFESNIVYYGMHSKGILVHNFELLQKNQHQNIDAVWNNFDAEFILKDKKVSEIINQNIEKYFKSFSFFQYKFENSGEIVSELV